MSVIQSKQLADIRYKQSMMFCTFSFGDIEHHPLHCHVDGLSFLQQGGKDTTGITCMHGCTNTHPARGLHTKFTSLPSYLFSSSSVNNRTGLVVDLYFNLTSLAKVAVRTTNRTQILAVAMAGPMFGRQWCGECFTHFPIAAIMSRWCIYGNRTLQRSRRGLGLRPFFLAPAHYDWHLRWIQ